MSSNARWREGNQGVSPSDDIEEILARALLVDGETIYLEVKSGQSDHSGVLEAMEEDTIVQEFNEINNTPIPESFALQLLREIANSE